MAGQRGQDKEATARKNLRRTAGVFAGWRTGRGSLNRFSYLRKPERGDSVGRGTFARAEQQTISFYEPSLIGEASRAHVVRRRCRTCRREFHRAKKARRKEKRTRRVAPRETPTARPAPIFRRTTLLLSSGRSRESPRLWLYYVYCASMTIRFERRSRRAFQPPRGLNEAGFVRERNYHRASVRRK